jgi:flagellar basal-body rod modification protein FlgD
MIERMAATTTQPETNPGSSTAATKTLATQDTFLKLLVAQIRNQNPLNPTDGIQFVSQLAQFTGVEESLAMRQDLDAIRKSLEDLSANASKTGK